jgi:hypothetical protein
MEFTVVLLFLILLEYLHTKNNSNEYRNKIQYRVAGVLGNI